MVKINEQVAQLINKLEDKMDNSVNDNIDLGCSACSCSDNEHEEYIYCQILDNYICDVCCRFELCNDYKLVNEILENDIFSSDEEVFILCEKYCSNDLDSAK